MPIKINCIHNHDGAWCANKKVKRSLFGMGARCCIEYPRRKDKCEHKEGYKRPSCKGADELSIKAIPANRKAVALKLQSE